MARWHDQLNGHEFKQALGDSEGQGGLACCSPGGLKELDMTQELNNNNQQKHKIFKVYLNFKSTIVYTASQSQYKNKWILEEIPI